MINAGKGQQEVQLTEDTKWQEEEVERRLLLFVSRMVEIMVIIRFTIQNRVLTHHAPHRTGRGTQPRPSNWNSHVSTRSTLYTVTEVRCEKSLTSE